MWSQKIVDKHNETQKFIRAEDVDLTKHKIGELKCQCIKCVNDFRAFLRDSVYESCVELIDSKKETIKEEIMKAEHKLGKSGRIFIRPSGTEKKIRIMAECEKIDLLDKTIKNLKTKISALIKKYEKN